MTTYAESIQRKNAVIQTSIIQFPIAHHLEHVKLAIAEGRYRQHLTYSNEGVPIVNKQFRDSMTVTPPDDVELALGILAEVKTYAEKYFDLDPSDALVPASFELFAYPPGIGIRAHIDDHVNNRTTGQLLAEDPQRGITTITYLNNDFEGGGLYFPDLDVLIKPEPGLLVIFPSNRNFVHEVQPITSGMRFSYQRVFSILNGRTNRLTI